MKRLILALTFGAFAAGSASAQLRLTLDDAIQMALSENPTIKVADLDVERYDYVKKETRGNLLPSLSASGEYTRAIEKSTMRGGISAQQLEQTKAALDVQKEVLDNLRKNIEMRSPIAGVVTARNYEAGNLFTGTPVLHVMQINPLKIIANIQEQYYPAVKLGMPVEIRTDIFPGEVFAGKVSLIYPALDASTRTFTVEVTVPNGNEKLRPGMFARSTFNMGDKEGIMVPDVAVLKQVGSSERYLYVVKDGKAERRSVKVGRQIGSDVDILSGVADGEQIAVTALSRLADGVEVEVKE